jgi:uncharacterized repeat protein (TIGR01451 family)
VPNNVYGYGRIDALTAYNTIEEFLAHSLTITKTASMPAIVAGESLTYTLTVSHSHPFSATYNVVLTDVIPANTVFVTATLPHMFDGTTIQWQTPSLAANATWQVNLVVAIPLTTTASIVENATYGVASDEVTAVPGTPIQTPITPIPHSLSLQKTASASEVMAGDWLTYTLTVSHAHPALSTTNVVLTDVIPTNSSFVTATLPFTLDGNTVQWLAPTLAPGGIWNVQLVVSSTITNTPFALINEHYGVRSDEVTAVVTGPPVITFADPFKLYLPFISNQ